MSRVLVASASFAVFVLAFPRGVVLDGVSLSSDSIGGIGTLFLIWMALLLVPPALYRHGGRVPYAQCVSGLVLASLANCVLLLLTFWFPLIFLHFVLMVFVLWTYLRARTHAPIVILIYALQMSIGHVSVLYVLYFLFSLDKSAPMLRPGAMLGTGAAVLLSLVIGICAMEMYVFGTRANVEAHRLCRRCRYDLTGNISGRCPECGELTEGSQGVA